MTNSQTIQISEVMEAFYDGPHATPPVSDDGPVFLGIRNMTEDGHLDLSEVRHIAWEHFPKWTKRVEPMPGDIVFTYEASLHRYAIIPNGFKGCLGRRIALIRPDRSKVDSRFLLYYLLSPLWRDTVNSRINIGSTVDRIPLIEFPSFPVTLPPMDIQRKITSALLAYDELIENNVRRIQILEEMAQSLYREWFLKPDIHWEQATFGTIASERREGVNPNEVHPDTMYIGLEHIPRRSFVLQEHGSPESVASRKWRFSEGDILFGKLRPYFHKVVRAPRTGICSTDVITIKPNQGLEEFILLVAASEEFVAHAIATSGGTDRPRARWQDLAQFPIRLPPDEILLEFKEAVGPMLQLIDNLVDQQRNLQRTRDFLLPKLVSGEIDVSDLNIDTSWLAA